MDNIDAKLSNLGCTLQFWHKKKIGIVVGGGIAAYRILDLIRGLKAQGAEVTVIGTEAATRFVTPLMFHAISGRPFHGDLFHPGEYIKDEIEDRDMSQQELADQLQLSKSEINLLIHGHRNITPSIALKLESVLEITAELWMNLQIKYEIELLKKKHRYSLQKATMPLKRKTKLGRLIAAA